jgi:hypothetical protein
LLIGGSVILPSGRTLHYLTQPQEVFLRPGMRYLLVLSYHSVGDFYTLGDDWDLSGGIVRPNTIRGQLVAREGRSSLSGLTVQQLGPALAKELDAQK